MRQSPPALRWIWIVLYFSVTGSASPPPAVPIWSADLSGDVLFQKSATIGRAAEQRIVFLNDAQLAIAFLFRSLPDRRVGQNFRDTIRSNAAVFLLNLPTGAVESSRSWDGMIGQPAASDNLELVPVVGGTLLCVGRQLMRLSSSLALQGKRELPLSRDLGTSSPLRDQWVLLTSPQSNSALLVRFPAGQRAAEDHWINVRKLNDIGVSTAPAYNFPGMALVGTEVVYTVRPDDDYIKNAMEAVRIGKPMAGAPVMIRGMTGANRKLCEGCAGGVVAALGRELVLISEGHGEYLIANKFGNRKFKGKTGNSGGITGASGSATVNRVAFLVASDAKFDGRSLESESKVVVLDLDKGGPVLEFSWREEGKRLDAHIVQLTAPKLALSPDGKHLAVLAGTTVRLYQVP